ncbi:MAG: response regulator [Myxococcales bacterium]|nr:response regulator [Myxococcales bacterium]
MSGEELLIADSGAQDREGLRQLFQQLGYVVSACGETGVALEMLQSKYFPAAVVDLDFGGPGGGLELIRDIQRVSQPTKVVMLAGRRSFEAAIDALRLGVVDVVSKRPDQLEHLQLSVRIAVDRARSGGSEGSLLAEVRDLLEEAFKIMVTLGRKVYASSKSSTMDLTVKPAILIVDEDHAFLQEMAKRLAGKPWDISVELSGGSGLDKASTFSFQIVAVRDQLLDLPGQMVLKSCQAQHAQTLGILYRGDGQGVAERYEGGVPTRSWTLSGPDDVVMALEELVDELSQRREDRRYMQAFRAEHGNFLKRFAELKKRIDDLTG